MAVGVTVIRRRWWLHIIALICGPAYVAMAIGFAFASIVLSSRPDGWWVSPLLGLLSAIFGLLVIIVFNSLFTYRVEMDGNGLRIIGNFYTHDLTWEEITRIYPRPNYRLPGYHVGIEVDGSRRPRRHWSNLWFAGYFIHPGMDKGGKELAADVKRRRSASLRRRGSVAKAAQSQ